MGLSSCQYDHAWYRHGPDRRVDRGKAQSRLLRSRKKRIANRLGLIVYALLLLVPTASPLWAKDLRIAFYSAGLSRKGPGLLLRDISRKEAQALAVRDVIARTDPDILVACVGGGSNAIGLFHPFLDNPDVRCIGVEASGEGLDGRHAATLTLGRPGILHGALSYLLQDSEGQVDLAHSISAGLDYPGVGPEHAWLKQSGRVEYISATDDEAMFGVKLLSETEGIIPALETAHAIAGLARISSETTPDQLIVLNCSGRGDKDMQTIAGAL